MRTTTIFVLILISILFGGNVIADVNVNLPDTTAYPDDTLLVPIKVSDLTGLEVYSYQFKIQYDSTIVKAIGTDSAGTLTQGWGKTWTNLKTSGEIIVGNYGVNPLQKSGVLIYVRFHVIGKADKSTTLKFQDFEFNSGQPNEIAKNGSIKIINAPISVSFKTNVAASIKIIVDGVTKNVPFDTTWVYGSSHKIGTTSPQYKTTDIRYTFKSWSDGGDTTHSVSPKSNTIFTLNMNEEFRLTLISAHGTVKGQGWYIKGTTATFSVDSLVQKGDSTRYLFKAWKGVGNSSYSGSQRKKSIVINDPVTETADWATQHFLKIISTHGKPVGQGWYNQGTAVVIGIDSLVTPIEGTRYVFDSWIGQGSGSYSGQKRAAQVMISAPILQSAFWRTEHYLWLKTVPAGITTFKNSNWYAKNDTAVTDTAKKFIAMNGLIYKFKSWSINSTPATENPVKIRMDTSIVAKAVYKIDSVQVTITTNIGSGTFVSIDGKKFPAPYSKFWTYHSEHTIGIDKIQFSADSTIRYTFVSWSDQGNQSHTVKADSSLQISASLTSQFLLSIDTYPKGLCNFADVGYYEKGDTVKLPEVQETIIAGQDTFRFKGWLLDRKPVSGKPIDVIMNSPHSAVALYKEPYSIKGRIINRSGIPVSDVRMILSGAFQDTLIHAMGAEYSIENLLPDSYRITPQKNGCQFNPVFRQYTSLQSNKVDQNFTVIDKLNPEVRLIYPNGGEKLKGATEDSISWQATDNVGIDSVLIDLSTDGGNNWKSIVKICPVSGTSHVWNIPNVSSNNCKIHVLVMDYDGNKAEDASDAVFSIAGAADVKDDLTENLPDKFEVQQNYPNPFNSSTLIRFQIPEAASVTLKIFNAMGQEIVTLINRKLNAGHHQVNWDGNDQYGKQVSSGVYFYQVETGSQVMTRKLLYIR